MRGFPDSSVGRESTCNGEGPGSIPGAERSAREGIGYSLKNSWASVVTQLVKNLPAMQETWVRALVWEDPMEKGYPLQPFGMENFMDCIVHGIAKSQTQLSDFQFTQDLRTSTSWNKGLSDTELTPHCPQQFQRNP